MTTYTTTANADPHTITVTDDPDLVTITITQADVTLNLDPVEFTAAVTSVAGQIGAVTLDTDDVTEGSNLYYTDGRFDARLATKDTDDVEEGASNLYYTTARTQAVIDTNSAGFITDYTVTESDVTTHQAALTITESQISDLDKYTDADFDTRLATKDTDNLSEGSNLYYTDARANSAIDTRVTGSFIDALDTVSDGGTY